MNEFLAFELLSLLPAVAPDEDKRDNRLFSLETGKVKPSRVTYKKLSVICTG